MVVALLWTPLPRNTLGVLHTLVGTQRRSNCLPVTLWLQGPHWAIYAFNSAYHHLYFLLTYVSGSQTELGNTSLRFQMYQRFCDSTVSILLSSPLTRRLGLA